MAEMKLELEPWQTPNFVIFKMPPRPRGEGLNEAPKLPLAEVDVMVLSDLCDEFRAEVFRKAGKTDPTPAAPEPQKR